MPRTADPTSRRRQLTDAVRHLVAAGGFDAVTVAAVARVAGVSVGLVQHYFPSKDELLVSAYGATLERIDDAVAAEVGAGEAARLPIREILPAAVSHYLPLDTERRTDHAVRSALLARSATAPQTREMTAQHHGALRERLAQAVRNGKKCGEVDDDVDAAVSALELAALIAGLADQLAVAGSDSDLHRDVDAVLRAAVGRTFPHPCRQHDRTIEA